MSKKAVGVQRTFKRHLKALRITSVFPWKQNIKNWEWLNSRSYHSGFPIGCLSSGYLTQYIASRPHRLLMHVLAFLVLNVFLKSYGAFPYCVPPSESTNKCQFMIFKPLVVWRSFSEYNPRLASTQTSPKPPYCNLLDLIGHTTTELFPVFQILTSVSWTTVAAHTSVKTWWLATSVTARLGSSL